MTNKKNNITHPPTEEMANKFDMLQPMLISALGEVREFSKKKQDAVLSPVKVKLINRLLTDIKGILVNEKSVDYLDLLDEDTLPQNGDAVLILGQYAAAMKQFRQEHSGGVGSSYRWYTKENPQ